MRLSLFMLLFLPSLELSFAPDPFMTATGKGVTRSLELAFNPKASTQDKQPLKPSTFFTVQPELIRG